MIEKGDLDALILISARAQWQKVAMITARVMDEAERRGHPVDEYLVGEAIRALVQNKQLEVHGELWMWQQSEVKLPG